MNPTRTSATPWNSIAEGLVHFEAAQLTHATALASPCASCPTTPCCTHLPLHSFKITNMMELDHALYLLNFDRIVLGLSAMGEWSVYYAYPCRFLDRQKFNCVLHNTPQQPQICVNYNPYQCWYKRVFTKSVSDDFLLIDRQRMEFIVPQIVFDESRNIKEVPAWEPLLAEVAKLPLEAQTWMREPSIQDPVMAAWQNTFLQPSDGLAFTPVPSTYNALANPCEGCEAYCCETLVFPKSAPSHISGLDYYRFCLGFPGVELGISDNGWQLVIKTTCRHLQNKQCAVYGQPSRPLICKYYDAWKCDYRINFGLPRPPGFVRVRLEQFEWLSECFQFDQFGNIMQGPSSEALRGYIEAKWQGQMQPQAALTAT